MKERLEHLIRGEIARGEEFFERHPGFFPERGHCNPNATDDSPKVYEEADDIRRSLNQLTKRLIMQGGELPRVIGDVTRMHEKIGLMLKGEEFFTQTERLAEGRFNQDGMGVSYFALRSTLTRRAVEGVFIRQRRVVTIDDLIHLVFDRNKSPEDPHDLGWVSTDITVSQIKDSYKSAGDQRIHRKRVEGLVWRNFRLAEAARELEGEMGKSESQRLTLISEMRTEQGLNRGLYPEFNSEPPISFGSRGAKERINKQIQQARVWIVEQIRQEIAMADPNRFRGGRPGTNPSTLYRFPSQSFQKNT